METRLRAIGYLRVSTEEQADSGLGLQAQEAQVRAEIEHKGWDLAELVVDAGVSAKTLKRPGLGRALEMLDAGEADVIVAAKLDRLSRSVADFLSLVDESHRRGWHVDVLDLQVDTSTPTGRLMATMLSALSEWERRMIGQRTSEALQALKAQGVRLGRPVILAFDPEKLSTDIEDVSEMNPYVTKEWGGLIHRILLSAIKPQQQDTWTLRIRQE